jgi:hypothetical protein
MCSSAQYGVRCVVMCAMKDLLDIINDYNITNDHYFQLHNDYDY